MEGSEDIKKWLRRKVKKEWQEGKQEEGEEFKDVKKDERM